MSKVIEKIPERVERGWAFLSERLGQDFYKYIDLQELDMDDANYCLIGQINRKAPANVIIKGHLLDVELGFCYDGESSHERLQYLKELEDYWKESIDREQATSGLSIF